MLDSVFQFAAQLLNLRNFLRSSNRHSQNPFKVLCGTELGPVKAGKARQPCLRYAFAATLDRRRIQRDPRPHARTQVAPLMYLPLATAGFALITLVITVVALSISLSA
jgi:hypothetical protein